MKKIFGGLNITWIKLVIFAILAGLYTGAMTLIPATLDTSFRDISIHFDCWVLFGIILIVNAKSPLDSALKTFVFFLISQPLVYLVQVPFNDAGFGLFRFYKYWFIWTLLTFPMAFVGYFMKKDNWWGLAILAPMLAFVGYHYLNYFGEAKTFFPQHLLSAVFCAATMIIYPLFIFKDKKIRLAGLAISLLILLAATTYGVIDQRSHAYETDVLISGGDSAAGIEFDDTYTVSLADASYGTAEIRYEDAIESYMVHTVFKRTGDTEITLTAPTGESYTYELHVERSSYDIKLK